MAKNININVVIQFPTLKGQDEETRNAEIEAWKAACKWAQREFPADSVSVSASNASPVVPTFAASPKLASVTPDDKGEWERKLNETGKRLRVTPRILADYGTREAYAQHLVQGGAVMDPAEGEAQETPVTKQELDEDDT